MLGDNFVRLQIDPQDFTKNVLNVFWGLKPEEEPLRAEGAAAYKRHQATPLQYPHTQCRPAGLPADMLVLSFKLIQTLQETLILTEIGSPPRQIYTDGRPLPEDPNPSWNGYSTGHWEGDTLVVETSGFGEGQWLDRAGSPLTSAARLTERLHRPNYGTLEIEMTVNDPKAYTRPWSVTVEMAVQVDTTMLEEICLDDEQDVRLYK